jgi:hypothetical protein
VAKALDKLSGCNSIFKFVVETRKDRIHLDLDIDEIHELIEEFRIPNYRVWLSPCGITESEVIFGMRQLEPIVIANGWNLSSRLQVLMHGDKRGH